MRKIQLLMILMVLPFISNAQRYFGIATSNWSGTNGLYLNPANIADSRHKFTIDLFSLNAGMNNNLATFDGGISSLISSNNLANDLKFDFNQSDFSILAPYFELRGPGAMVSLTPRHSIALTTRVRAINQFHNFNQSLYRTIVDEEFRNNHPTYNVASTGFNYTVNAWSEIGLSYGGVIYDGGKHFVKGGITLRYLMGAGYFSMVSTDLNATAFDNTDSLRVNNSDLSISSNIVGGDDIESITANPIGGGGNGFGGDIGFVYEWRPDPAPTYDMDGKTGIPNRGANKYRLRISASITDFGAIRYKKNNFVAKISSITDSGYVKGYDLGQAAQNYDSLKAYAKRQGFNVDTGTGSTPSKVVLPTSIILGADVHIIKGLYANLTYVGNMANHEKYGNSFYGQMTLTPRYDTRVFSVGVPLTYDFLTKSIKAGVGLRAGGFFVGSDDMIGLFGSGKGANVYFGAYIPVNYKKPRDSDNDLVSNKKDKCKKEPGVWEEMGCPVKDKDGDGILDTEDECPEVPGVVSANGCPDRDGDGVADGTDRCPDIAGLPGMQGCPDRDGDGIADIDDNCPDVPGLAQYKGCPDTDGDGIADDTDECPDAPGPIANQGCPDTDNDGLADNMDKCPDVPGTRENYGCPEVSVEVKKRLAFAATAIQFDLGKSSIQKQSHKILDEIVGILNDYPDYYMTIDGYTDNTGNAERNLELSKLRANSVRDYFISKGVAADRLVADGHGDANPVASNKTSAGRAKNRRVEMDLKLKD